MSEISPSKSFILPGINNSSGHNLHNLSNRNLRDNFASIGASSSSRTRDRAYSIDSSADSDGAPSVSLNGPRYAAAEVALSSRQLQHLFPYHISVDKDFNVVQMGEKLYPLVRCIISPTSKKRINQHISKYFKIVSPAPVVNNWDAKMLTNLQVYSPSSAGVVEIELVSPRATHGHSQRFGEEAMQLQAQRLLLRGRFHELCSFSSTTHAHSSSQAIHEDMEEDGSQNSDKINHSSDYPGGVYLFLLHPAGSPDENWASSPFAQMTPLSGSGSGKHFVPSPISSPVIRRDSMDASAQEIARLMAANAALMAENERLKEENSGKDVRGMLGNVAHDLKTPLAAFMGAVELIKDISKDCDDLLVKELHTEHGTKEHGAAKEETKKTRAAMKQLRKSVHDISQQATGARDINQFMTMTINRCIDYTKAAQGVKLVPRNETVNLTEVLAMPINCMIASQTNVQFRLHNPPVDICTHVITDKIWLQENMLCLLSNAAKYSNAGRVDIKISLFPTQCLADAAERANNLLNTTPPNSGSHKNETLVPTENIQGPLSAKQVLVIHNQRQDRAVNLSPAHTSHRNSIGSSKDALSRKNRGDSVGTPGAPTPSNRRATQAPVTSSTSSKVLSPVLPYRATIAGSSDATAMVEAASRNSAGYLPSQPISIPSYAGSPPRNHKTLLPPTSNGAHAVSPVGEKREAASPRAMSGRMESRPRAGTTTDPLLQTPKDEEDYFIPRSPHGSGNITPKSTATPLSPLSAHFNINNPNHNVGGHALNQTAAPRVAASPTNHHNHHHAGGLISTAIGNAMGLIKGTTGRLRGVAGGSSPSQSRNQSQSTSQSHSLAASRSQSLDVPDNASTTSASGSVAGHSSQPLGKLRRISKAEKMRSSVRTGETDCYDDPHQLQDDIEAMAMRGSFSSDCEAEEGDRPSVYSEYSRSDSRQVSTDSRHSLRYSDRDSELLMKSFDEVEEESAKATLSQHHMLYSSTASVAYSPSSYSYLASNNLIPATPVEVFPQSSGGLFANKPIQKIQTNLGAGSSNSDRDRHSTARNNATSPNNHHHHVSSSSAAAVLTPLLLVEIEDTGIGLTESNMSKLFSPFMQAQRLAGGTGLGLYSLSKRLDALGGHYGVECRKDGQPGSLFWFAIPYREDADAASSNNNMPNSPLGTFQRQGSTRLEDLIMSAPLTARGGSSSSSGDSHHHHNYNSNNSSNNNSNNTISNPNNHNSNNSNHNTNNNHNKSSHHLTAVDEKDHTSSTKSIADPEPANESAPHSLHCSSKSKSSSSLRSSTGSVPAFKPAVFMHNMQNTTYQNQNHYHSNNANAGQDSPGLSVATAEGSPNTSSAPIANTNTTTNTTNTTNPNRTMHFLLVDDSESILKITSMLLARAGHTVERAENGVIALDRIAASLRPGGKPFDVVLMDLLMPVLDGLEATKRLREIEAEQYHNNSHLHTTTSPSVSAKSLRLTPPELPRRQIVVGLSANGDEETINDAYNAGVDRFIEKPFSLSKLLEALQEIHLDSVEDAAGGV